MGDVLFHSGETLHGTEPNLSDRMREAYILVFLRLPAETDSVSCGQQRVWRARSREDFLAERRGSSSSSKAEL